MDDSLSFELLTAGAFAVTDRGTVIFGPYVGSLPAVGATLHLVRPGRDGLTVRCAGIEDMWRGPGNGREFGVLVVGVGPDDVVAGDLLRHSDDP